MKRGFTLLELLAVIAIIGVIATFALVSLQTARRRARDTAREANIQTIKKALELHFNSEGSYPGAGVSNDCQGNGSFANTLQPLVDKNFINAIPRDPFSPTNAHPLCFYYLIDSSCGTGDNTHPYALVFGTETLNLQLPSWSNEPRRYCVYP